eukprot:TRINITY_DN8595_c0_g1_i1.p1 TRINITY_DN8595_c0_g1~~TRINITY_DN8595_c0_g1_i1.p1  ORF type:complete len:152 (-),score=15.13 TRINITY_DN8595_c0_g1_i1:51-506(-)
MSVLYQARCHCGKVGYDVTQEPLDSKYCHCRDCQKLHGAPFQWALIFHKSAINLFNEDDFHYYNSSESIHERILPCKISCEHCRSPIADEGRNMWLGFGPNFIYGYDGDKFVVPESFKPSCHIFYRYRVVDMYDDIPKFLGHKNKSDVFTH